MLPGWVVPQHTTLQIEQRQADRHAGDDLAKLRAGLKQILVLNRAKQWLWRGAAERLGEGYFALAECGRARASEHQNRERFTLGNNRNGQFGAHIWAARLVIGFAVDIANKQRSPSSGDLADDANLPTHAAPRLDLQFVAIEGRTRIALVNLYQQFAALVVDRADRAGLRACRIERPIEQ